MVFLWTTSKTTEQKGLNQQLESTCRVFNWLWRLKNAYICISKINIKRSLNDACGKSSNAFSAIFFQKTNLDCYIKMVILQTIIDNHGVFVYYMPCTNIVNGNKNVYCINMWWWFECCPIFQAYLLRSISSYYKNLICL